MKIRGFLAILVLAAVVVYFLWIAKAGKDQVVEEVKTFIEVKRETTKANMTSLAREIHSFIALEGRTPKDFKEFRIFYTSPVSTLDAWGIAIKYERLSEEDFRLISAGQDRSFNTSDDIISDY